MRDITPTRFALAAVFLLACGAPATAPPEAPPPATPPLATPPPAAPQSSESAPPFAMAIAAERLKAAADSVQDCKQGDLAGDGRVQVVFVSSGDVQSATVHGAPFEATPTGACVAERMRAVKVPPFSGPPFPVDKRFTIR